MIYFYPRHKTSQAVLVHVIFFTHFIFLSFYSLNAQQAIELHSSSYPGPIPNGPTTVSQTVQFRENTTGTTFINMTNPVSVTASFSNQQFTSVPGAPAGICFGGDIPGATDINLVPVPVWNGLDAKGTPAATNFTSNPYGLSGTGIDVTQNYGFFIFTCTNMWLGTSGPPGLRAYYGDLVFTFSRPVSDPVLQIAEMAGIMGPNGIATELELPAGSGLTLTKLSGTSVLNIPAANDKILNSSSTPANGCGSGGAICGSVRINGTNISSVTFRVYVRFENNFFSSLTSSTTAKGDAFIISFSSATFNLSGNVFNDANGLTDNTVNGTPTNAGGGLHALAVDANGNVQGTMPVSAGGAFSFRELYKGSYNARLSAVPGVLGNPAPAASLPAGWVNTGENLGTGSGSDGNVNGDLTLSINTSNVINANLGIERIPVAYDINYTLTSTPAVNSSVALNGAVGSPIVGLTPIRPNGSDAEDGVLESGKHFVVNTLPTNGTLNYNGIAVTANQSIPGFNPNLLNIQFTGSGYSSVSFTYSYRDAAGISSLPATYILDFPAGSSLPVVFTDFTATLQNNDEVLLKWQTSSEHNNRGFHVQHSTDGRSWETLGFVAGAWNSNTSSDYSYVHRNVSSGMNYYRLQQEDTDGKIKLSYTRLVNTGGKYDLQVYPNPAQSELYIVSDSRSRVSEVMLLDITGRQVLIQKYLQNGLPLDISRLKAGTYLLKVRYEDGETSYKKVIKR